MGEVEGREERPVECLVETDVEKAIKQNKKFYFGSGIKSLSLRILSLSETPNDIETKKIHLLDSKLIPQTDALTITFSSIGTLGYSLIEEALLSNSTISSISLTADYIKPGFLVNLLCNNSALTSLSLCFNHPIEPENTIQDIVEALKKNSSLTSLYLGYANYIGDTHDLSDSSLDSIAQATLFEISHDSFGLVEIIDALTFNTTLTSLQYGFSKQPSFSLEILKKIEVIMKSRKKSHLFTFNQLSQDNINAEIISKEKMISYPAHLDKDNNTTTTTTTTTRSQNKETNDQSLEKKYSLLCQDYEKIVMELNEEKRKHRQDKLALEDALDKISIIKKINNSERVRQLIEPSDPPLSLKRVKKYAIQYDINLYRISNMVSLYPEYKDKICKLEVQWEKRQKIYTVADNLIPTSSSISPDTNYELLFDKHIQLTFATNNILAEYYVSIIISPASKSLSYMSEIKGGVGKISSRIFSKSHKFKPGEYCWIIYLNDFAGATSHKPIEVMYEAGSPCLSISGVDRNAQFKNNTNSHYISTVDYASDTSEYSANDENSSPNKGNTLYDETTDSEETFEMDHIFGTKEVKKLRRERKMSLEKVISPLFGKFTDTSDSKSPRNSKKRDSKRQLPKVDQTTEPTPVAEEGWRRVNSKKKNNTNNNNSDNINSDINSNSSNNIEKK